MALAHIALAALNWDPTIKGWLIVGIAVVILPGSVYLLLATNTGSRLGGLLAFAGIFGWLSLMGIIWTTYGIGYKGTAAAWTGQGVAVGNPSSSGNGVLRSFPSGWKQLKPDDKEVADATAAGDAILAPPSDAPKPGLFKSSSDYVLETAYEKGGERYSPLGLDFRPFNFKHRPHYVVLQVRRVVPQPTVAGQPPPKPRADPAQPPVSVLLERNLGALRVPAAVLTISCVTMFLLLCLALHLRDKRIWAARDAASGEARTPVGVSS